MGKAREYNYKGALITVDMAARMAGCSVWTMYDRLKKYGGDVEMAINAGGKTEQQLAEDKIMAALGYGDATATLTNSGERYKMVTAKEPPQHPAPECVQDIPEEKDDPVNIPTAEQIDERRQLRYLNVAIKSLCALRKCGLLAKYHEGLASTAAQLTEELRTARSILFDKLVDWEALAK